MDSVLGLHAYSLHLHGMGQNWGGFKLQWEPVWDIFGLMDEAKKLGLDGLHLTARKPVAVSIRPLSIVSVSSARSWASANKIF